MAGVLAGGAHYWLLWLPCTAHATAPATVSSISRTLDTILAVHERNSIIEKKRESYCNLKKYVQCVILNQDVQIHLLSPCKI